MGRALGIVAALLLVPIDAGGAQLGDAAKGRELYVEKCVLCHGDQGQGWDWQKKVARPPVPVPDLASTVPQRSDQYLFEIVKHGGEAVERTRFMPGFGFQMTDDEIWHLVAYMRALAKGARR